MVLKWRCHNQNKNTCKELSPNEVCSLDVGTQCRTNLHGIALKNNELNVAMVDLRHWGLILICVLYAAWQRGVFADIFAPVHNDDMSTRFLCAQSCTANIFVYTNVHAWAKCDLFQLENWLIWLFYKKSWCEVFRPKGTRKGPKMWFFNF